MKKSLKIILIVVLVIIGIVVVDTVQARILKNSPIISWKAELEDLDSWVDKGILMDTYYCTKEKDIVNVSWHLKTSKFTCPIDNVTGYKEIKMETNSDKKYSFSVLINDNCNDGVCYITSGQNICYKCIDEVYIHNKDNNTKETLYYYWHYVYQSIDDTIKIITDELEQVDIYKDGGSIMYKNKDIAILKCNTLNGNRDIYIGKSNLEYESDYCKNRFE